MKKQKKINKKQKKNKLCDCYRIMSAGSRGVTMFGYCLYCPNHPAKIKVEKEIKENGSEKL